MKTEKALPVSYTTLLDQQLTEERTNTRLLIKQLNDTRERSGGPAKSNT
jgi:hypothetical protein